MDYIRGLPLKNVMDLIVVASEDEFKEKVFREYLAIKPHMKEQIGFEEYYSRSTAMIPSNIDTRSTDDIMKELEKIRV